MPIGLDPHFYQGVFMANRRTNTYFADFFRPAQVFTTEDGKLIIDTVRDDQNVAVAVRKNTGTNMNTFHKFSQGEIEPPLFSEGFPISAELLMKRQAGETQEQAAQTSARNKLLAVMAKGFSICDNKIQRAYELMAAQIFMTGKIELKDADGNLVYDADFKPKASHYPTSATLWSDANADPIGDIEALCDQVAESCGDYPTRLHFGKAAWLAFINHPNVKAALESDNRRIDYFNGQGLQPRSTNNGNVQYMAVLQLGTNQLECVLVKHQLKNPQTGARELVMPTNKVMFDTFGDIESQTEGPNLIRARTKVQRLHEPDRRVADLLPSNGEITSSDGMLQYAPWVNPSEDGKAVMGMIETQEVFWPQYIDSWAVLTCL